MYCTARPPEPHGGRRGVSPRFEAFVKSHDWRSKNAVDIGCGTGAATVLLAKLGARAVGVDIDPLALSDATERVEEERVTGVRFVCADAEAIDYRVLFGGAPLGGAVAHLCFSEEIARRASNAIAAGGAFVIRAFHKDMWKEAGRLSEFARSAPQMRTLLTALGFRVVRITVERRQQKFASFEEFIEKFLHDPHRRARWEEDGRIATLSRAFARGERKLSEAFLVVNAVKRERAPPKKVQKRAKSRAVRR